MNRYNAKLTEKKWRERWEKEETYLTSDDRQKKKCIQNFQWMQNTR